MLELTGRYAPLRKPDAELGRDPVVARHRVLGGLAVLKLAKAGSVRATGLLDEAQTLSDLDHPHLVQLIERVPRLSGFDGWGPVEGLSMRWVDGARLTDDLDRGQVDAALLRFGQLLDAVRYLHRRGLLHLDVKPDNALVTDTGVVLLDLGSARPLDAAPGEAGGTLGYAAPEVLVGEAASRASDVYSLGAVLYELLAGQPPHGGSRAVDLRQSVLAGDVVPLRAVAPGVPRQLARLVESMLAMEPARRPRTASAVAEQLGDLGHAPVFHDGEPPFSGRSADVERVRKALSGLVQGPRPAGVVVSGPPGMGRTRLIRHVFRRLELEGHARPLDLTQSDDPLRALGRIASTRDSDLPARAGTRAWVDAVSDRLGATSGAGTPLFFGRREGWEAGALDVVAALDPAIRTGGWTPVWAGPPGSEPEGNVVIALGPQTAEELVPCGRFFGLPAGSHLREAVRRAGGSPGAFVSRLSAVVDDAAFSGAARQAWQVLQALPSGVPAAVVGALSDRTRSGVQELVEGGKARVDEAGACWLLTARIGRELTDDARDIVRGCVVDTALELDPLWRGLAALAVGEVAVAAAHLDAAYAARGDRRVEFESLAESLAARGDAVALHLLVQSLLTEGENERVVALLEGVTDRNVAHNLDLARALYRTGRHDAADALAAQVLDAGGPADFLLVRSRCAQTRGDLDLAWKLCKQAATADPDLDRGEAFGLRIVLAVHLLDLGRPPDELDALLGAIERRADAGDLGHSMLGAAARLHARLGDVVRSAEMLGAAAAKADAMGDLRAGAGLRLNQGNQLQALGRGREARVVYSEALAVARRADSADLIVRVSYSLAMLEIMSGRIPAAETHLAVFREHAARLDAPEVEVRGKLLQAEILLARGQPAKVRELLTSLPTDQLKASARVSRDIALSKALLALQQPGEALSVLLGTPQPANPLWQAQVRALRGRAHVALGRADSAEARALLPEEFEPMARRDAGEVLLAVAGEDLDPQSFERRRDDLDRAARWLRGEDAGMAATLRDRLLGGPGARLEGIVDLAMAMNDVHDFPKALARLVTEALGAHRVLITLRIPGLGRQSATQELSGHEAAGITEEVLRRIRRPDDYWLAANAFADPHIRKTSATVRTFELKSLLAVAIPSGDRAVGALYVDDLHRANRFTLEDVQILQRLAQAVGRLVPLLQRADVRISDEPLERYGVLVPTQEEADAIEATAALIGGRAEANLLITGPTGAGKSVLARRVATEVLGASGVETVVLHRKDPQMLVSQLMGTRRGEFTGAVAREGAIQRALEHDRVLFLDEIQNLDEVGQAILLPLLDLPRGFAGLTDSSRALGGKLHILLGTNVELRRGAWQEHFREDLWYRMTRARIDLTPLARRGPEIVYRYLAAMLETEDVPPPEVVFDAAALRRVTGWTWPGNLRQLHSFAEDVAHLHRTGRLERVAVPDLERMHPFAGQTEYEDEPAPTQPEQAVVEVVKRALRETRGVQKAAAEQLQWTPSRLNKYLKRMDLGDWVKDLRRNGATADLADG